MSGYPYTSQVEDAPTRKALINAFDRVTKAQSDLTALTTRVAAIETPAPVTPAGTTTITTVSSGGGAGPAFGPYGPGDLIAVDSASTLLGLADIIAGNVLLSGGVNALPSWGKLQLATHVIGTLPVGNGGTGLTSYTVGDLLYASGAAVLAKLADVATGNALISGGVTVAPSWGKIGLTTHVSGRLPYANLVAATAASILLGRGSAGGSGDWQEVTLGTGLTMTGTVLSSSGGGSPGGSNTQVQFNNSGAFGGDADLTFVTDTLTATKIVAPTSLSTPSIITASGALTITPAAGSNLNIALSTTGDLAVNTNQFYVDTSQVSVGIGTTTPFAFNTGLHGLHVYATDPTLAITGDGGTTFIFGRYSADALQASLLWVKGRGTLASPAVVQSGDTIGALVFQGVDVAGSALGVAAGRIDCVVDSTPGTNDMPGRLVFSTTPDGTNAVVERMRIDNAGNVGIGGTAAASAKLEIASTTGALLIPRMTTTQRDALTAVNGMLIYNSTTGKFQGYEAGAWNNFSIL